MIKPTLRNILLAGLGGGIVLLDSASYLLSLLIDLALVGLAAGVILWFDNHKSA